MLRSAFITLLVCAVFARAASYTTYIGDANQYQVTAVAADAAGNTYVTGGRVIVPATHDFYFLKAAVTDVFVGKLDPAGNLTLLGTFNGKGTEQANGIAVDPSGNIYVVGSTTSTDFPLRNPLQSAAYTPGPCSGGTGFLLKLSSNGMVLYSTYLGGSAGNSSMLSVAADSQGNAYVTGTTAATDYPHTMGMPAPTVYCLPPGYTSAAFFAKIDPTGSRILYAGALTGPNRTCVGGSSCFLSQLIGSGSAVAVDAAGNAYIAGNTNGRGLPTTPGALLANGVGAFVAKVNPTGGLVYVTYLGAGDSQFGVGTELTDTITTIAADSAGNAYIAGSTSDPSFPTTAGAFQPKLSNAATPPLVGPSDAFVAKLNPTGSAMVWATYLGGTAADAAQTIATDPAGDVWVSGTTKSTDFPTTASVNPKGSEFLAELNSTGSALLYSAVFPANTEAQALAVDSTGTVHVGGATGLISAFVPASAPGQTATPWLFGIADAAGGALAGRLVPGELISLYGLHIGPAAPAAGTFNEAGFLPTSLGGVQVTINGIAAPLLYVSDGQINAVAPVELTAGSTVQLQITQNGTPLPAFRSIVDLAAPGVFLNADGSAAAINQDGTVNSRMNPAPAGSYVSIWATGTGYFPGSDGQLATDAAGFCGRAYYCSVFQFAGTPANVLYSGAAPGTVNGVIQVNFQVNDYGIYYLSTDGFTGSTLFVLYIAP